MADQTGSATAVSLAALAETLDIRPPSLYNHVAGLDDLQGGLAVLALRQLLAALRKASTGLVGRPAIIAMADAYRRFAHTHPGIYPLTLRAPEPDEDALQALSQELVQLMMFVMASMGLQGEDAIHAIRGLRAVLHGFVSLEAGDAFKLPETTDASFSRLVSAYLDGVTGAAP